MMRLLTISHRLAACAVLALLTVSAQAQTPGPFQSAPGPAPVVRPAPHPRPPAAEPQPAVVAPQPAPAAPARPEGALSAAELRQFIDATWTGTSPSGGEGAYFYPAPDGRAFIRGNKITGSGHWSIENDTFCIQWDNLGSGRRNCVSS